MMDKVMINKMLSPGLYEPDLIEPSKCKAWFDLYLFSKPSLKKTEGIVPTTTLILKKMHNSFVANHTFYECIFQIQPSDLEIGQIMSPKIT